MGLVEDSLDERQHAHADPLAVVVGLAGLLMGSAGSLMGFSFFILFSEVGIWLPPFTRINTGMNTQADCLPALGYRF